MKNLKLLYIAYNVWWFPRVQKLVIWSLSLFSPVCVCAQFVSQDFHLIVRVYEGQGTTSG